MLTHEMEEIAKEWIVRRASAIISNQATRAFENGTDWSEAFDINKAIEQATGEFREMLRTAMEPTL